MPRGRQLGLIEARRGEPGPHEYAHTIEYSAWKKNFQRQPTTIEPQPGQTDCCLYTSQSEFVFRPGRQFWYSCPVPYGTGEGCVSPPGLFVYKQTVTATDPTNP